MPHLVAMLALLSPVEPTFDPGVYRHPHCPKKVEINVPRPGRRGRVKMSVSHLTVTFNKDGFAAAKKGQTWHLANSHFVTEGDVKVGGHDVAAGDYSLLARKVSDDKWELVLDTGGRFRRKVTENARALKTEFLKDQPLHEHLRVDINPAGDEGDRKLTVFLEVHFDRYLARALVEIP